jgi:kanosamine 6-kinase
MSAQLGIDLGGTKVAFQHHAAGAVDRMAVLRWAPGSDAEADLRAVADTVRALGVARPPIGSVGVAVPATLDGSGRVVAWPSRPGWVGVDLAGQLSRILPGAEVRLADDGDLSTLAEANQAGGTDLLYLGVGTGVGGGLFLGGRLLSSRYGPVAEVGHMLVASGTAQCRCGRRGCLQAVASGPAVLARAAQLRGRPVDTAGLTVGIALGAGWAVGALAEAAGALAAAVVTVCEMVRPALVRIGGGFGHAVPGLTARVAAAVRDLSRPGHPPPAVEPATHGPHSSLVGATLLASNPDLLPRPSRSDP